MQDPILNSIRKYKDSKRFIFEEKSISQLDGASKTVKEIQTSINNVVKGTSLVKVETFQYDYSTSYAKISGTLDGVIKWVYQRSDTAGFYITTDQLVKVDVNRANQLKILTTYFTTEEFNNMISDGLTNKSFS